MNIFVLDKDPVKAAQAQSDKHCVQMIRETGWALAIAVVHTGGTVHPQIPYMKRFKNHPCSAWATESNANFEWLKKHGIALCEEYTYRYGKRHAYEEHIRNISPGDSMLEGDLTTFALNMPDECLRDDPVEAYRTYYQEYKATFMVRGKEVPAKWTKRAHPKWFTPRTKSKFVDKNFRRDGKTAPKPMVLPEGTAIITGWDKGDAK